jgi:polynucleotide 5'-hydroxyl-kinase GRC3/NOL9
MRVAGVLDVPDAWRKLALDELSGTLLVVGAPDTGKSTFARYLHQQLQAQGRQAWFLDGDPGQSALGPPTTLTCTPDLDEQRAFTPVGRARRMFIGSTSPSRHMLPLIVAGARLAQAAQQAGAEVVIYDTSGLVDPQQGGLALKLAKIELLRPAAVFALQCQQELEPLLLPLRRSRRTRVVELRPSPAVQRRDPSERREHRARQFARYFAAARPLQVDWTRLAVFPSAGDPPLFRLYRLAALEDLQGFTLGLGIVMHIERDRRKITLLTPLASLQQVDSLRLGDVLVNPETYQDDRIE